MHTSALVSASGYLKVTETFRKFDGCLCIVAKIQIQNNNFINLRGYVEVEIKPEQTAERHEKQFNSM